MVQNLGNICKHRYFLDVHVDIIFIDQDPRQDHHRQYRLRESVAEYQMEIISKHPGDGSSSITGSGVSYGLGSDIDGHQRARGTGTDST